jgi:hypothetical protein
MKKKLLFISYFLLPLYNWAQNIDSILAEPQTIELSMSTPEPRMKETFQISIDIQHLRGNIFRSLVDKVELANDISNADNGEMTINVTALKKGKNQIGPLIFTVNKTQYTTNKILYNVIDPLPNTDNGIWVRKVKTSDSSFCIIIEQRIPAYSKTTTSENSTSYTTEPEYNEIVKFKEGVSINGTISQQSHSSTNFSSIFINGEEKQFMYGYSVYHFSINDKKAKIKITKDKFLNLPKAYKFEDIIVQ